MNKEILCAELSRDEGRRKDKYCDVKGIETCGIGHNIQSFPLPSWWAFPLTDAQIDQLYRVDIRQIVSCMDRKLPWWRKLDEVRQHVLLNIAFNVGVNGLVNFKKMLAAAKVGDWKNAKAELLDSEAARLLPQRYVRLAKRIETGI